LSAALLQIAVMREKATENFEAYIYDLYYKTIINDWRVSGCVTSNYFKKTQFVSRDLPSH
jgi:hypothetical protein